MKKKLLITLLVLVLSVLAFTASAYATNTELSDGDNSFTAGVNYDDNDITDTPEVSFTAPEKGIYSFVFKCNDGAEMIVSRIRTVDSAPFNSGYYPQDSTFLMIGECLDAGEKVTFKVNAHAYKDTDGAEIWTKGDSVNISVNVSQVASSRCNFERDKSYGFLYCNDCGFSASVSAQIPNVIYGASKAKVYDTRWSYRSNDPETGDMYYGVLDLEENYDFTVHSSPGKVGENYAVVALLEGVAKEFLQGDLDELTLDYYVNPKKASISTVTAGTKCIKVKAGTKVSSTGGSKYQIQYRVKGTKSWKSVTSAAQTTTVKNLKKGKKYEVRVRAKKGEYVGNWSTVKTSAKVK